MRRSFLFVPGDSQRKIEKAAAGAADVILLDLEDAVAPSQKGVARQVVKEAVDTLDFGGKSVIVRINGINTPFASADLKMLQTTQLTGVMLPKVESADMLIEASQWTGELPIYALIESALGILNLPQIIMTTKVSLAGLAFGGEDYVASIGATATVGRQELLFVRSAIVNAAAAINIPAIDTVFTDFHNIDGLRADAKIGRQLGFSGKLLIHPKQVEVVNELFTVDSAERDQAAALLLAYEHHLSQGVGVFSYEGKMVDEAIIRRARHILAC